MSGNSTIQSLLRGLEILSVFTREKPELRLKEIVAAIGLAPSTTHRLLRTLEQMDYIVQSPENGKYRLGARSFIIGANVVTINRFVEVSLPYIAKLTAKFNVTTHMAVEQNNRVLCIEKIDPPHSIQNAKTPPRGTSHPFHLTAGGKSILAYSSPKRQQELIRTIKFVPVTPNSIVSIDKLLEELERVRLQGYSLNACESAQDIFCFATPILQKNGLPIGSISVSVDSPSYPDYAKEIIHDLKNYTNAIEESLNQIKL